MGNLAMARSKKLSYPSTPVWLLQSRLVRNAAHCRIERNGGRPQGMSTGDGRCEVAAIETRSFRAPISSLTFWATAGGAVHRPHLGSNQVRELLISASVRGYAG
jgi:hypothetical protein